MKSLNLVALSLLVASTSSFAGARFCKSFYERCVSQFSNDAKMQIVEINKRATKGQIDLEGKLVKELLKSGEKVCKSFKKDCETKHALSGLKKDQQLNCFHPSTHNLPIGIDMRVCLSQNPGLQARYTYNYNGSLVEGGDGSLNIRGAFTASAPLSKGFELVWTDKLSVQDFLNQLGIVAPKKEEKKEEEEKKDAVAEEKEKVEEDKVEALDLEAELEGNSADQ